MIGAAGIAGGTGPGSLAPWAVFCAFIPWLLALRNAGARTGTGLGFVGGFVYGITAFWWVAPSLAKAGHLPLWLAASLFLAAVGMLIGVPHALAGMMLGATRAPSGGITALWWVLPVGIAGSLDLVIPSAQPSLGLTDLAAAPAMVGLGGLPALNLAVLAINSLFAVAIANQRFRPALVGAALVFALHLAPTPPAASDHPVLTVGIVQPAAKPGASQSVLPAALDQAEDLTRSHPEVDLVILPELPEYFLYEEDTALRNALAAALGRLNRPLLVSAVTFAPALRPPAPGRARPIYSLALALGADGTLIGNAAKTLLVPFVEAIPGEERWPWLRDFLPRAVHVRPGPGVNVIALPDLPVLGPLLCFETVRPERAAQLATQGANVLVELSNDTSLVGPGALVHEAMSRFRAMENGLPLVRANNSGPSGAFDARGRPIPGSRLFAGKPGTTTALVIPEASVQPGGRAGRWILVAAAAIWFVGQLFAWQIGRRCRS